MSKRKTARSLVKKLLQQLKDVDDHNIPHFDEFPCGTCELIDEAKDYLASSKRKGR